eukprot:3321442-Amphidinium_carterae.1
MQPSSHYIIAFEKRAMLAQPVIGATTSHMTSCMHERTTTLYCSKPFSHITTYNFGGTIMKVRLRADSYMHHSTNILQFSNSKVIGIFARMGLPAKRCDRWREPPCSVRHIRLFQFSGRTQTSESDILLRATKNTCVLDQTVVCGVCCHGGFPDP